MSQLCKVLILEASSCTWGHVIDENGLHPTDDKIAALKQAPTPKNVTQLRSFFGLINYYSKFLANLSTKLRPLYNLLLKNKRWTWTEQHDIAFKLAKEALQADSVLAHYDITKPLLLACDASEYKACGEIWPWTVIPQA